MAGEDLTDNYVADLLKADAKKTSDRYTRLGFSGLLPERATNQAPKPNIRFLRNIIRETDSHNAALLAKEAEESRAKLREFKRGRETVEDRATSPRPRKRRRSQDREEERSHREDHGSRGRRSRSERHKAPEEGPSRKQQYRERDLSRSRSRSRSRHKTSNHHSKRNRSRSRDGHSRRHRRSHKHRSESTQSSRTRSASPSHRRTKDDGRTSRRRRDSSSRQHTNTHKRPSRSAREPEKTPEKELDSDPLEDIVGPLPPRQKSPVRIQKRGRGAFTSTDGLSMDAHFAKDYDPSMDVRIDSDNDDDWGQSLEALRDRQKWKQQGADRLRQAGFTEDQVNMWEKGGEKTEENVKWAKKGESREWDKGKVLDDEGNIVLKPEWGRLKGT